MKDNKNNGPKIPKKVKIGQRTYRIHVKMEADDIRLRDVYGYTKGHFDDIVLRENMSKGQKRSTLLHELLHAISIVYGNPFAEVKDEEGDNYDDIAARWEHYMITLLEEHVVTMFRNNPKLVDYLINGE